MHMHTHTCMHTAPHTHTRTRMHARTLAQIHYTHTHTHIYIYIDTHSDIQTQILATELELDDKFVEFKNRFASLKATLSLCLYFRHCAGADL